jgi:anti-sigma-K factor RskA
MRYTHPKLLDHLAATYALGTLRGGARRRFEVLLKQRADLGLLTAQWQNRVHRLAASVPPAQPSARVWRNVQAQIQTQIQPQAQTQTKPQTKPQTAAASSRMPDKSTGWWSWLSGSALVGAGFAAAMMMVLLQPLSFISVDRLALQAEKLPQSYVGLLLDDTGAPAVLASSVRQGKTLTVKMLKAIPTAPGMQLRLWALPTEGAPFLVGVIPPNMAVRTNADIALADTSEKLFAKVPRLIVTSESAAAPATTPQGTPLLSGHCVKLW